MHRGVAVPCERDEPVNKIRRLCRQWQRIPAKLVRRRLDLVERSRTHQAVADSLIRLVHHRWAYAVGPCATVEQTRRGKRAAAQLLRVKAEARLLRCVLADRKGASDGLGGELVA